MCIQGMYRDVPTGIMVAISMFWVVPCGSTWAAVVLVIMWALSYMADGNLTGIVLYRIGSVIEAGSTGIYLRILLQYAMPYDDERHCA